MSRRLDDTVFTVAGAAYSWEDVILAGVLWGDWLEHLAEVREGLACQRRAAETGDPLPRKALQRASEEFRYARDLISAEETERWLAERGLGVDHWVAFLRRGLLRAHWRGQLAGVLERYRPKDGEVDEVAVGDAFCSGLLERLSRTLAGRAALHQEASRDEAPEDVDEESWASAIPCVEGLGDVARVVRQTKMQRLGSMEAAYGSVRRRLLTAEAVDARIRESPIEWIRVGIRYLAFADEQAAREAALCLREDGLPIAELARGANLTARELDVYLEDIQGPFHDLLLSAARGETVGPALWSDLHVVAVVRDKRLPAVADPDLRSRAEQRLLASHTERATNKHVRWGGRS